MWHRHSLIYPVIFFLLLAISATLAVGYTINFAILEDVLRERMARQAQQVGDDILQMLDGRVQKLERFKNSWLGDNRWSQEESGGDVRALGGRVDNTKDVIWRQMKDFFPLWGVDFILLLDPAGQVVRQTPDQFVSGQPMSPGLLERVRTRLTQEQAVAWHLEQVVGQWQIMFFVPVKVEAPAGPYLLVFGQGFDKMVSKLLRENPTRPFLIADLQGVAAGSRELLTTTHFQQEIAVGTIRSGVAQMAFDSGHSRNLYYTPVTFLEQTFSLVVPVALDEVRQVLTNSRQRLIFSFLFIVVFLLGLGILMERILLRPLRRLRVQAATMVSACSREEQALHLNLNEQGNEIIMLERAMEEASIKLYAHVAHLVDTKSLLEGFALKDPITELGNRRMLDEFLSLTLGSCKRKERQVAVILIVPDLPDKHVSVAESEEHNLLLRELAIRLRKQMRGEDLAFRVQHNEFVAFAPECGDEEQILSMVYRLHHALTQPYSLSDGHVFTLGVHMGVAVFPGAGEQGGTLLANARVALETTYTAGRRPFSVFNYPYATDDNDEAAND